MRKLFLLSMVLLSLISALNAQTVYLMNSGDPESDEALRNRLISCGLAVVDGVGHWEFDGTQSLADIDVVLLPPYLNYGTNMPIEGQNALKTWIQNGGGLVTLEWTIWMYGIGFFEVLGDVLPAQPTTPWRCAFDIAYSVATPDSVLNADLPDTFSVPLYKGETFIIPKTDATIYYHTNYDGGEGAIGWDYVAGRVISISFDDGYCSTSEFAVSTTLIGQLICNAARWAARGGSAQPGDVNGDGCVNDVDLLAVLFAFGNEGGIEDLDRNGFVDDGDLLIVLFNFGNGC